MIPVLGALVWWAVGASLPALDAPADAVVVDGVGPVLLVGYDCVSVARSSTVSRVCHEPRRGLAIAEVRGRHSVWCDVPRAVIDAWLAAPSMGRFLVERVEPAHRCAPPGVDAREAARVAFETPAVSARRPAVLP